MTDYKPPSDSVKHMEPNAPSDDHNTGIELERRVCPNCRLYFDTGVESESVFCSTACQYRHKRGEYV